MLPYSVSSRYSSYSGKITNASVAFAYQNRNVNHMQLCQSCLREVEFLKINVSLFIDSLFIPPEVEPLVTFSSFHLLL